jgi:hypothetical protein
VTTQSTHLRFLTAMAMACAVAALAGCGSGGGSSSPAPGADPATIVPASSPVFLEATVRPQGDQRTAIEGALSKLLGTSDVGQMLVDRLDKSLQPDHLSYADDIAPWLGERAGVFFTTLASKSDGAAVIAATDSGEAQAALDRAARSGTPGGPIEKATYNGVSYETQDAYAFGIVGDFAVIGTPPAFKAAVDASKGSSLAESDRYTSSLSAAPADRIATAWADPAAILDAVVKSGAISTKGGVDFARKLHGITAGPVVAWVDAATDHLALEVSAAGSADAANGPSLITGFPDDAWLAFGASNVGQGLALGLKNLSSLPSGGFNGVSAANALDRFRALTGLDLANIGSWLDDVSGFASGTSIFSLGGAVVLSSRNQAATAKTLAEIHRVVTHDADLTVRALGGGQTGFSISPSGVPVEVDVALRDGKLIAGLGAGSIDAALSPSSRLGDSSAFKSAAGALGSEIVPSFYFDFQSILGLISLPGLPSDPSIEQVKPYLDRLDYVIAGAGQTGGRSDVRIVLGLRDAPSSSASGGDVSASRALPVAAAR